MKLYGISTAWVRAQPGSGSFLDAWANILNSLLGRWGMDDWSWAEGKSGVWRMVKGRVEFSVYVDTLSEFSFVLPITPSKKGALILIDEVTNSVTGKVILIGMETISLHLANPSVVVGYYETER